MKNVGKALFWFWVYNIVVAIVFFGHSEAGLDRLARSVADGLTYLAFYIWLNVFWQ